MSRSTGSQALQVNLLTAVAEKDQIVEALRAGSAWSCHQGFGNATSFKGYRCRDVGRILGGKQARFQPGAVPGKPDSVRGRRRTAI